MAGEIKKQKEMTRNPRFIVAVMEAHAKDATTWEHTQTTITSIVGVLKKIAEEYSAPELLTVASDLIKELNELKR